MTKEDLGRGEKGRVWTGHEEALLLLVQGTAEGEGGVKEEKSAAIR